MAKNDPYDELMLQLKVVKDRVRGVVRGTSTGFYLHGGPGTSKSYTILSTLELLGVTCKCQKGHITAIGLFRLLQNNPDGILVLDDVSSIFNQPIALQLLLAALGNPHDGTGIRRVTHTTANGEESVDFVGGIICISNVALKSHKSEVLRALNDRIYVINYDPSQDQIVALINHIASKEVKGVAPVDAKNVAQFLIKECRFLQIPVTVRLFIDKAIEDFRLHKMGGSELHWHDLIRSSIQQQLVSLSKPVSNLSRAEKMEADRRIALDIYLAHESPAERIAAWTERTGKSQKAFYRRVSEIKKEGRL